MKHHDYAYIIFIAIMSCAAVYLYHQTDVLENDIQAKNLELNKYILNEQKYEECKDYILLHSDILFCPGIEQFKKDLKQIADISKISELSMSNMSETGNTRQFVLDIKYADEQAGYRFVYYLERIMHGVVNIQRLEIDRQKDCISMRINVIASYSNLKFCGAVCDVYGEYKSALEMDIADECGFNLMHERVMYKVNGIIGNTVSINNKTYKSGSKIGDYIIEKVNEESVIIMVGNGDTKKVALGTVF